MDFMYINLFDNSMIKTLVVDTGGSSKYIGMYKKYLYIVFFLFLMHIKDGQKGLFNIITSIRITKLNLIV